MNHSQLHKFHIPVMGLAFTIDSPVKVARFGISSVISIVEDKLIEVMRKKYYPMTDKTYFPITTNEPDFRARRITDYLNLVNAIVRQQIAKIKSEAFEVGSDIVKYFEMLPDEMALKQLYHQMMKTTSPVEKERMTARLRDQVRAGSIDVNIMTKIDRNNYNRKGELQEDGSDAVAALRGYANSDLINSSVIFSAGMNPRLYNYLVNCPAFEMNEAGVSTKKIVVKVSDYRSALIQGKYLAKRGLWVSEFRIESGLNCGGHAFATEGYLMGPILEDFKLHREELIETLFNIYREAVQQRTGSKPAFPPPMRFSAQGGIGTCAEADFLLQYYKLDSTGWGTPFLLVPEATTVDAATLHLLRKAKEEDIVLSHNSPLGVRFYYLQGSSAEKEKLLRIKNGKPGSPCTEKHLAFNTEFTKEPICTASHKYQKLKVSQLQSLNMPEQEYKKQLQEVLDKECLCVGLSNAAAVKYSLTFIKNRTTVNICPGPNIVNFSRIVSLHAMTDHIYDRKDIPVPAKRPHMFIAELFLYIDHLKELLQQKPRHEQTVKEKRLQATFCRNLKSGINYYQQLPIESDLLAHKFGQGLNYADLELDSLNYQYNIYT